MTDKLVNDAVDNVEELAEKIATADTDKFKRGLQISLDVGSGILALSASCITGTLAFNKFRSAYQNAKGV